MAAPQPHSQTVRLRFGVFEVDLNTRELFKRGTPIRIQTQPFKILCAMLERPGETVSREELRRRLWPADTFVEYEDSLNTAVRKLRAALSDSSGQPRYVETVARRGYRLIAPITPVFPNLPVEPAQSIPAAASSSTHSVSPRFVWIAVILAGVIVALVATHPAPVPRLLRIVPLTHSGSLRSNQKLLTDGPRIYFVERVQGHWLLKWMPATGGNAIPVALPFPADFQDISPDGSELLVRDLTDPDAPNLWTVAAGGGAPHRLGIGALAATYARDGRSLLYADWSTVYVCDRDGGNRRELTTLPGAVCGITMAPQGDRLRFYVDQGVNDGIALWESQSDGARLHRVIDGWTRPEWQWGGSWNPDGRWFVFSARRNAAGSDVWLLGESGLLRRPALFRLTSGPMDFVYPIFSPDGKRIFVVGISRRGELLRYDFKTREFTHFLAGMSAENVDFSPDGQSLIYVTYPEGRLWRSRADGSAPVPLTTAPMRAGWAFWSPDGTRIAFAGQPAVAAYWNLYVSPATGGSPEPIAANIGHAGFTWRSDSRAVIVGSDDPNAPLRVVDLEEHSSSALPGTQHFSEPYLSNKGRYLLVRTTADTLAVFDLTTQRTKQLETAAAEICYPRWSADDRYVYFNRFLGTTPAAFRVRVADGFTERLMDLTEFSATGSWGAFSALAPDGSLLLLRDLGGVDLYAIDWSTR